MRSRTRWRSASSRPCSSTKSRSTSSPAERPQRQPALAHRPPAALFLAAHDAEVFLRDQDLGAIEAAEGRAVTEQLAGRFQALVIHWGRWLPDVAPSLVVVDPAALIPARPRDRNAVIADLQARTRPAGVHVVLPTAPAAREVIPLAPEALQALYGDWHVTRRRRTKAGAGLTATKPERHADTAPNVSDCPLRSTPLRQPVAGYSV